MDDLYAPDTDDLEELTRFFDDVDSTEFAEVEEVRDIPARENVTEL